MHSPVMQTASVQWLSRRLVVSDPCMVYYVYYVY
jgi:hypothetical protein